MFSIGQWHCIWDAAGKHLCCWKTKDTLLEHTTSVFESYKQDKQVKLSMTQSLCTEVTDSAKIAPYFTFAK